MNKNIVWSKHYNLSMQNLAISNGWSRIVIFTLNPVGHQSTNSMFFLNSMAANALLTSLGTTSPRYNKQQPMYLPVRGSHFTIWFNWSNFIENGLEVEKNPKKSINVVESAKIVTSYLQTPRIDVKHTFEKLVQFRLKCANWPNVTQKSNLHVKECRKIQTRPKHTTK